MDRCIDDNLTDLNVISLLPVGVKLSVRSGKILHEKPKGENVVTNFIGSAKRWFYNDNRNSGVMEIYTVVKQSIKILTETLSDESFYRRRYMELLPKVKDGIDNYKITYEDDSFIISKCNVIINGINSVLKDTPSSALPTLPQKRGRGSAPIYGESLTPP